jgi:ADP-ribose pyrophosphatase
MKPDSARPAYEGEYLGVSLEVWNGREREIVERPDVVAVVAVDRGDSVVLVRQLRPAARQALLELPAGRVEADEDLLESARRELAEETGLHGGVWRAGPTFWTTPGFCRERVHLFVAEELEAGKPEPDEGEELEIVRVPVADLGRRLEAVEDGKTLVGLLLYLRGRDSLPPP